MDLTTPKTVDWDHHESRRSSQSCSRKEEGLATGAWQDDGRVWVRSLMKHHLSKIDIKKWWIQARIVSFKSLFTMWARWPAPIAKDSRAQRNTKKHLCTEAVIGRQWWQSNNHPARAYLAELNGKFKREARFMGCTIFLLLACHQHDQHITCCCQDYCGLLKI